MHPVLSPVRERLEAARAAGLDFDTAWPQAIDGTSQWWRSALAATRDEWASAYQRADRVPAFDVLATVAAEGDALSYFSHLPSTL